MRQTSATSGEGGLDCKILQKMNEAVLAKWLRRYGMVWYGEESSIEESSS